MASQFVYGTYKSYKIGTEKILNWLHENATKCGYGIEPTTANTSEPKKEVKKKPKPKPKKGQGSKAKGIGKAKNKKVDLNPKQTKAIPVREFTVLAETIASSERKIKVPLWVLSMIKEVISARKKSARWFSGQTGDTTSSDFEASNIGHQHFIGVLERVLELLGRCQTSGKKSSADTDKDDPLAHITNLFEVLEVDEIEEDSDESTPSAPTPKVTPAKVVYEEEPSAEEVAWLIYCFFEDFNIARERLKDMWTTYKRGKGVDLAAVALATNTAFEMFQRAETELMAELKAIVPKDLEGKVADCKLVIFFLFGLAAEMRGQDPFKKLHPIDRYNHYLWDIADWICLPVLLLVHEFLPVIKPGGVPICQPGYFGKLSLSEDVLDPRQKFVQDTVVLLERLLPEIIFLARAHDPFTHKPVELPGQDELTKGVLKMVRTKEVPLWLILALQVQLDIHYVLLEDASRPCAELLDFSKRTVDTINEYLEFSKDMEFVSWPKSNDKVLEQHIVFDCKMWIDQDFLDPVREEFYKAVNRKKEGDYVLFKRHPVLCGMMLFRLTLLKHDYGQAFANGCGGVQSILHLYNAAIAQGVLAKPWMDMEALIIANSAERIFIGGRPDKPREYLTRFVLAMGMSPTAFASNQREPHRLKHSQKGPRQMLASPAIAQIYAQRYVPSQEQKSAEFVLSAVEQLLLESALNIPDINEQPSSVHGSGEQSQVALMGGKFQISNKDAQKQKGLSKKFAKTQKLTTIQLLTALDQSLRQEAFALNVDYFSLHMRCYELLRILKAELDASLIRYLQLPPMYIEKESQLPFLTAYILQVVEGASKTGEITYKIDGKQIISKILIDAGRIMSKFVDSRPHKGAEEIEKVKKICSCFGGFEVTGVY